MVPAGTPTKRYVLFRFVPKVPNAYYALTVGQVQRELLEVEWPVELLNSGLKSVKEEKGKDGTLLFKGVRVRMVTFLTPQIVLH